MFPNFVTILTIKTLQHVTSMTHKLRQVHIQQTTSELYYSHELKISNTQLHHTHVLSF